MLNQTTFKVLREIFQRSEMLAGILLFYSDQKLLSCMFIHITHGYSISNIEDKEVLGSDYSTRPRTVGDYLLGYDDAMTADYGLKTLSLFWMSLSVFCICICFHFDKPRFGTDFVQVL